MSFKKYTIQKGKHSAKGFNIGFTFNRSIAFEAYFDENCLYEMEGIDKYDINKLYGFTTNWYHHSQSARVGWRCLDGENIQLLTYSYNNGVRDNQEHDLMGMVKPGERFYCEIIDLEDCYLYSFRKSEEFATLYYKDEKQPDWWPYHYNLFPYFGGNKTAPHDMNIYIRKVTHYKRPT